MFLSFLSMQSQTFIPVGSVSGTWKKTQSPFYIQGNIYIGSDSTLVIEPGVEVLFDGNYIFIVYGILDASGNETDSILFTAIDTVNGWQGIEFEGDAGTSNIKYCILTHGNKPYGKGGAIKVYYAENIVISHCLIENNYAKYGGGIYIDHGKVDITHSKITQNHADEYAGGIECRHSTIYFWDLEVTHNLSGDAGGIDLWNCPNDSYHYFKDLTISNNIGGKVGGLMLHNSPTLVLDNCKISYNQSRLIGGIAIFYASLANGGNPAEQNQVYMNKGGLAFDLYFDGLEAGDNTTINIDTFTVLNPDSYLVYPLDKFDFLDGIEFGMIQQADTDLYISPTGSDANDGLTPGSPMRSFENALRKITSDSSYNNTLWVMPGQYHLTESESATPVYLKSDVRIKATVPDEAILDGDSICRVFFGYYKNNYTLSGLTIQNGYSIQLLGAITFMDISGGGLHNISSNGVIDNCSFISNHSKYLGGGTFLDGNCSVNFNNCKFIQNSADMSGGGLFNEDNETGPVIINNCLFSKNHSGQRGGGLAYYGKNIYIENCKFIGNTSVAPGAGCDYHNYGQCSGLINCLFSKNISGEKGGGIYISGFANSKLINCTFSDNQAVSGSAVYQDFLDTLYSINSIFWNTEVPTTDLIHVRVSDNPALNGFYINYSDLQGGESSIIVEDGLAHWEEGNIVINPEFIDPANGDYSLNSTSPCIEAGKEDTTGLNLSATDLKGDLRIVNSRIDMGAYEFKFPGSILQPKKEIKDVRIIQERNPSIINIEFVGKLSEKELLIRLFSLDGTEKRSMNKNQGIDKVAIQTENIATGIYLITISDSGKIYSSIKILIY